MVLQLIKDKLGNYIYKDAMEVSKPPVTSQEFEAYTGGSKTTLAGTTDLGTQTQALMRETPGQTRLITDPVTGETKTESDIQSVAVQQKDFVPPTTQELIAKRLEGLDARRDYLEKQRSNTKPRIVVLHSNWITI